MSLENVGGSRLDGSRTAKAGQERTGRSRKPSKLNKKLSDQAKTIVSPETSTSLLPKSLERGRVKTQETAIIQPDLLERMKGITQGAASDFRRFKIGLFFSKIMAIFGASSHTSRLLKAHTETKALLEELRTQKDSAPQNPFSAEQPILSQFKKVENALVQKLTYIENELLEFKPVEELKPLEEKILTLEKSLIKGSFSNLLAEIDKIENDIITFKVTPKMALNKTEQDTLNAIAIPKKSELRVRCLRLIAKGHSKNIENLDKRLKNKKITPEAAAAEKQQLNRSFSASFNKIYTGLTENNPSLKKKFDSFQSSIGRQFPLNLDIKATLLSIMVDLPKIEVDINNLLVEAEKLSKKCPGTEDERQALISIIEIFLHITEKLADPSYELYLKELPARLTNIEGILLCKLGGVRNIQFVTDSMQLAVHPEYTGDTDMGRLTGDAGGLGRHIKQMTKVKTMAKTTEEISLSKKGPPNQGYFFHESYGAWVKSSWETRSESIFWKGGVAAFPQSGGKPIKQVIGGNNGIELLNFKMLEKYSSTAPLSQSQKEAAVAIIDRYCDHPRNAEEMMAAVKKKTLPTDPNYLRHLRQIIGLKTSEKPNAEQITQMMAVLKKLTNTAAKFEASLNDAISITMYSLGRT